MALAIGTFMCRRASRRLLQVGAVRTSSAVPLSSFSEPKIEVPWNFHSCSGFRVATKLQDSLIPGAGLGRFVSVPVKAGEIVRGDPIVKVCDYANTYSKDSVAIAIQDEEDIDRMVAHWSKHDKDQSQVRLMMSWFMGGVPSERSDCQRALVYVTTHSCHFNHGHPGNIKTVVEDGILYHKASRSIKEGEELVLDYLDMGIQPYAKDWCAKHGLIDVQTLAANIEKGNRILGELSDKVRRKKGKNELLEETVGW